LGKDSLAGKSQVPKLKQASKRINQRIRASRGRDAR
jgi:hypothetical protein